MPRRVDRAQVLAVIAELARTRPAETLWVGIDGPGGAGKSTLATHVAADVEGAVVVEVDDFSGPQVAEWDWPRFEHQVVAPLLAGRPARYQVWNWDADAGAEWREVAVGSVVLVEGVSATRSELVVPWDVTVWVETPREVRLARARERDGPEIMIRWHEHWIPSEEAYIAREHPQDRVDLIVPGF